MKKILIILFILLSISISGQNVLSFVFQPDDLGIGLKYDRYFARQGLYVALSCGHYQIFDKSIEKHIKLAVGRTIHVMNGDISIGINYHYYNGIKGEFDSDVLAPVSFEIGCSTKMSKRIL